MDQGSLQSSHCQLSTSSRDRTGSFSRNVRRMIGDTKGTVGENIRMSGHHRDAHPLIITMTIGFTLRSTWHSAAILRAHKSRPMALRGQGMIRSSTAKNKRCRNSVTQAGSGWGGGGNEPGIVTNRGPVLQCHCVLSIGAAVPAEQGKRPHMYRCVWTRWVHLRTNSFGEGGHTPHIDSHPGDD